MMTLLELLRKAHFPIWINDTDDEIYSDEYYDYSTAVAENIPRLDREVKYITVGGDDVLVIEI